MIKKKTKIKKIKVKIKKIKQKQKKKTKVFNVFLSGEKAFSKAKESKDLYSQSHFGEIIENRVYYSLVETLYLLEKGKINLFEGKKKMTSEKLMEYARKKEPSFFTRYRVYKDLRNRGYIVKTALKFGADFRVYSRGIKPGQNHAKWIVFPVYEATSLTWQDFAAKNRVAHSTRKNLLIAIVDEEGDVTYYEIEWKRP